MSGLMEAISASIRRFGYITFYFHVLGFVRAWLIRRVLGWMIELIATYTFTHNSGLQVIKALSLLYTLYIHRYT
jgi:hypothetical protein